MKVLVTGGAGYVGSACLRRLLQTDISVFAYDNLSLGHAGAIENNLLVVGDLSEGEKLTQILIKYKIDAVMHFAASACVGESVEDPGQYYRNNVGGTLSLLNAMRAANVHRLIFSSTCATYGAPDEVPISEAAVQRPCNPYGRTKLAVEWMIKDFSSAYGLGYTLLRYFNAAGASPSGDHGEDHRPETHLIPLVFQAGQEAAPLTIFGNDYPTEDGTCIRDYIHVDDLAEAHLLALEATQEAKGNAYNLGTGRGFSVSEVISACREVSGLDIPYVVGARRAGDPAELIANSSKIIRDLGWKPQYLDISEIAATAWRWHRRHPNGYTD